MPFKKLIQPLPSPSMTTTPIPSRKSSLQIITNAVLQEKSLSTKSSIHFQGLEVVPEPILEVDTSLEPTLEEESMSPIPETSPVLSQSPPTEQHTDFSQFKWNEVDDLQYENDYTTDDEDMDLDYDSESDYIDHYLDDLELEIDISQALLNREDALATCVAISSPGKPKLIDIPPSPIRSSSESDMAYQSRLPRDHEHKASTASSYSSPSSASYSERRPSEEDQESNSSLYSPVTPRSSTWSLRQQASPVKPCIHDQSAKDTDSSCSPTEVTLFKSPFSPYNSVYGTQNKTFDDVKFMMKDSCSPVSPISLPPMPSKENNFWTQAKARAKSRKKSIGGSWFK